VAVAARREVFDNPAPRRTRALLGRPCADRRGAAAMNDAGDWVVDLFGLAVTAGVPVYLALQVWLPWRFAGGWRKAALAPLWPMGAVLAWTLFAFIDGSNLFPLVLIFTAPFAALYLLALLVLHWFRRGPAQ
jgi:hypothetical protein